MGMETTPLSPFFWGMQMVDAYGASSANKDALNLKAQTARNNAQLSAWQSQDATRRGQINANAIRMRGAQLKGTQRATMAANGVDLGVGSALRILSDTDLFTGIDAGTALDNAAREAWALRNQAAGFTNDAGLYQSRADAERPGMAAFTSLLGNARPVASSWYRDWGKDDYPGDGLSQGERRKIGVF